MPKIPQKIPKNRVKPFGTADAVFQTMDQIEILKNSSFCVCNSDNLYSTNSLRTIRENAYENAVLAYDRDSLNFPKERVSSFSILMTDDNFNLLNFIEKPTQEQVDQNLDSNGKIRVSMNIFKFNGLQAFDFIKNCPINPIRNEKELPSAIVNMINENDLYMKGIPIAEHVPDLTSKADININAVIQGLKFSGTPPHNSFLVSGWLIRPTTYPPRTKIPPIIFINKNCV